MNYESANYCFLDTESSGIDDDRGVVEVAWVMTDADFNILSERQALIDPERMIDPSASGVHGLTNADLEGCPTLAEFFSVEDPSCYGRKLPGNTVVVGHRISFDTHTIGPHIDGEFAELDTLRWVRRLYPDASDHKLQTMIYALNLPRSEGAHRALADVMSAYHLCRHICDRTGYTLKQLAEASEQPMQLAVFPFGKWKGTPFKEVPRSYLYWAINNMKGLDADIRSTIHSFL
jgi:DNA polymerase III epsilon subunit-like protein